MRWPKIVLKATLPNEYLKRLKLLLENGLFLFFKLKQLVTDYKIYFSGYNVTPITLALCQAAAYSKVYSSLDSILTKHALNPSDITNVSFKSLNNFFKLKFLFLSYTNYIHHRNHHLSIF